jgi:hypothetical protein
VTFLINLNKSNKMKISNLRKLSSLILISLFISCTKEAIQENNELPQSFIDSINTNGLQLMNPKEYNELPIIDATEVKSMLNNELSTRSTRIKLNTPPVWIKEVKGLVYHLLVDMSELVTT